MKFVLFLIFLFILPIKLIASKDSTDQKSKNFSLVYHTFPTIESGIILQYHLGKISINLGGFTTFNKRDNFGDEAYLPSSFNDSIMYFRYGIFSTKTKSILQMGVGYDQRILFLSRPHKSSLCLRTGLNFSYGKFNEYEYYGESKLNYFKDSTNQIFYFDMQNQPTLNRDDASFSLVYQDDSRWEYKISGITPFLGLYIKIKEIVTVGFTYFGNIRKYKITQISVNDRMGIIENRNREYIKYEHLLFISLGIEI